MITCISVLVSHNYVSFNSLSLSARVCARASAFYYAMLTIYHNTTDSVKHEHKTRTRFYFVCSRRLPPLNALKITWHQPHSITHVTTKVPSYVTTWIYLIDALCCRIKHFIIYLVLVLLTLTAWNICSHLHHYII